MEKKVSRRKPPRNEYIYMDCQINLSTNKMANLLYACIMSHAEIGQTYGIGIYEYNRQQNAHNGCQLKIIIHPDEIELFEQMSGVKLSKPISVQLNN